MRHFFIVFSLFLLSVGGFMLYRYMTSSSLTCASSQPVIVAFGDSLVTGYGASEGGDIFTNLSNRIGVPIYNLGVSGDTSARALARIQGVLERKPDIVVVLVGGNDALQGVPVAETEATIGTILSTLKSAGVTPILAGVVGGFPNDSFKPMFERLAEEHEVVLVSNVLAGILGDNRLMSDAIHPNAQGYARIAERLQPILERVCASS